MQSTDGLRRPDRRQQGCFAAFKAVYECAVPVIAAVNGYCVGGGVGLVGNADIVVASDDAYFGVPEVNQGALGAATHMARLVPQHLMRTLYFTAATIPAAELLIQHGSVLRRGPARRARRPSRSSLARRVAAKDGTHHHPRLPERPSTASTRCDVGHQLPGTSKGPRWELNLMGIEQ